MINLLKTILKEKQIVLRDFILEDKTKPEIDETVAIMFRVTMAIKTIENGKEVRDVEQELNKEQEEAANFLNGIAVIVAGAGQGRPGPLPTES